MSIRTITETDRTLVDGAIVKLKEARNDFTAAKCPGVVAKVRSALASADGARRNLRRRLEATKPAEPQESAP